MSPALRLYLAFSRVSAPLWRIAQKRRVARGKELPERLPEKWGSYRRPRPEGTMLWFHALSVGESLALVPLIERALRDLPDAHVLLTTSTAASAGALGKAGLPERCLHVLAPVDTAGAVRRFLGHWRPDVSGFAELDFWPRLMVETHRRGIPMILINSRLRDRSFESRKRIGGITRDTLQLFGRLLVQDPESFERFKALGADPKRISVVGALKAVARPLPADPSELAGLKAAVANRFAWLAASTWGNEHPEVMKAHRRVTEAEPGALLIVAPRQLRDADGAEAEARKVFAHVARRSRGEGIGPETQVYIADTIGEMGLWYRIAPVSFVGHSLDVKGEGLEGKNPYEAAALGSAILHGPAVPYFAESYAVLKKAGAAREVADPASLASAVLELRDTEVRAPMLKGAERVIAAQRGVLENTWAVVRACLPESKI